MRLIATILLSSVLYACSTTNVIEIEKPLVAHPSLPKPVKMIDIEQNGIVIDNKSYIIMDVANNQKLRIYMEDVLRYIKNVNSLACSYRKELNEPFCADKY